MALKLKAIANILSIQESTVHRHLANIRQALDVCSSIEMFFVLGSTPTCDTVPIRLTPRGVQVFSLIEQGMSDIDIARCLEISYSAVRRHREKMLLQNQCNTMLELIAKSHGKCPCTADKIP